MSKPVRASVLGAAALATVVVGKAGYDQVHDMRHPTILIGTVDKDVADLYKLLKGSKYSAYDAGDTAPTRATEDLMGAVLNFQLDQGTSAEKIGIIKHNDDTWDRLSDTQAEGTPEDLPTACYEQTDVICITQDAEELEADIHVLHDGELKFAIEGAGVGTPDNPTDNGSFEVVRMHKVYFSKTYGGVAMPYAMFFNKGEAVHLSRKNAEEGDNYPGSAGCVTIGDAEQARILFDYTQQVTGYGRPMRVIVTPKKK